MNTFSIEQMRNDVRSWAAAPGRSVLQLAKASGVEQKSLARFVARQSKAGLSGASIEKLWPILYGDQPQQKASGE
jgi:hypothetical protein